MREVVDTANLKLLYIASNHASHTPYAIQALNKGVDVFIEKPICVNNEQFEALKFAIKNSSAKVYAGFNRPYSTAVKSISKLLANQMQPITFSCFVFGHKINKGHWYKNEGEGTRVMGNVCHWIDLAMHLMNKRGHMPTQYKLSILSSNADEPDDNFSLTITNEYNDLINIVITSREEPFEGIYETLHLQSGSLMAIVHDYRYLQIWDGSKTWKRSYFPKDVGHKKSVLQPFLPANELREWKEVEFGTALSLKITEMIKNKITNADFILQV